MKQWIKQICEWELYSIKTLLNEGYSIPKIANKIGRNKTTLYRLFAKNNIEYKAIKYRYVWGKWGIKENKDEYLRIVWKRKIQFQPHHLHLQRQKRKSIAAKRYCRIQKWWVEEKYILEKIKQYYSPKQISWRWRLDYSSTLSKDTIYSYIYNTHKDLIKKFFRRKGKKYQHKRKLKYQLSQRRMIDKRPKSIEQRTTLWHWESDTVVWKRKTNTKKVILTHVERKSWFLIARVLENSQAESVVNATNEDFLKLPKYKRKTMTFDNGREFAYHYDIEKKTKMRIYFAHPYCSWERWTNENTNWLLRQFLPKGTDFEYLTQKKLQKYVTLINNRPRERLGFKSPSEVFFNKKSCIWL